MDQPEVILVVSSDVLQRSAVSKYLRECGYRVIEATGLEDAKLSVAHHSIDVIVSDVAMRDGSGFDLSTHIRSRGGDAQVVLTQSLARTAEVAGDLCERGPLERPYHPQQLVDEIKRLRATRR
jgi:DNA-binding NtrC family response regulator